LSIDESTIATLLSSSVTLAPGQIQVNANVKGLVTGVTNIRINPSGSLLPPFEFPLVVDTGLSSSGSVAYSLPIGISRPTIDLMAGSLTTAPLGLARFDSVVISPPLGLARFDSVIVSTPLGLARFDSVIVSTPLGLYRP
jgi:hypothetical protein